MIRILLIILYTMVSTTASQTALIVIDVQECFLLGGSLAVDDGNQVIPVIKRIREQYQDKFDMVVFTQDWHCKNHVSFASQFSDKEPYDKVKLSYNDQGELCAGDDFTDDMLFATKCSEIGKQITQTLWPDHCIKDVSSGPTSSKISDDLKPFPTIVKKGQHCQIDAYSAFNDNGNITQTELNDLLRRNNITTVFLTGLAFDYCVYYTALDAVHLGYNTYVIKDATRGVAKDTTEIAEDSMKSENSAGQDLHLITTEELRVIFHDINGARKGLDSNFLLFIFTLLCLLMCLYIN